MTEEEQPATPVTCDYCGKEVPADATIELKGDRVCASCKEEAVGRIKSGITHEPLPQDRRDEIKDRISANKTYSFLFGVPGFLLQVGGRFLMGTPGQAGGAVPFGALIMLVGAGLLITGFVYYARSINRSGFWGLAGFLSCAGVIILYFLGRICRNCSRKNSHRSTECDDCGAPVA